MRWDAVHFQVISIAHRISPTILPSIHSQLNPVHLLYINDTTSNSVISLHNTYHGVKDSNSAHLDHIFAILTSIIVMTHILPWSLSPLIDYHGNISIVIAYRSSRHGILYHCRLSSIATITAPSPTSRNNYWLGTLIDCCQHFCSCISTFFVNGRYCSSYRFNRSYYRLSHSVSMNCRLIWTHNAYCCTLTTVVVGNDHYHQQSDCRYSYFSCFSFFSTDDNQFLVASAYLLLKTFLS